MTRKLPVDLSELETALHNSSHDFSYVLDTDTGAVLLLAADESQEVEEINEEIDPGGDEETYWKAFDAALDRREMQDWRRDAVRQAARIASEYGTRYRPIGRSGSQDGYRDMEEFIETIDDPELQGRLDRAIVGRGAFRSFKDVLCDYPRIQQRWYAFQSARERERALAWLRAEGIEPLTE